jgi:hypothetical protein
VSGGPLDLDAPSIVATNSAVHSELLDTLQEVASAR